MNIELDYGIHNPIAANERFIFPTLAYVSTYYCKKYSNQCGVTLFWGFLFQWWRVFFEIRVVTGKIKTPNELQGGSV